jgi:AraC-like DNA-binding protein
MMLADERHQHYERLHDNLKKLVMNRTARYIFLSLLMMVALGANGARQSEFYSLMSGYSSNELLKRGARYSSEQGELDSALVCYTIVTSRYDKKMSKDEKRLCAKAYIGKWYVYFLQFYDFTKSYECLTQAEEISNEIGEEYPAVYLNFGCMYQSIFEQYNNMETGRQALSFYRRAFYSALKQKNRHVVNIAFGDLANLSFLLNDMGKIRAEWNVFKKTDMSYYEADYDRLLYLGLDAINAKRYDEALKHFNRQISITSVSKNYARNIYLALYNRAIVYERMNNLPKALESMKEAEHTAYTYSMIDCKIDAFRIISGYLERMGDKKNAEAYRNHYYSLKDTLFVNQQLASLNELKFMNKIQKLSKITEDMTRKRHVQNTVICVVLIIVIIVIAFLLILFRKNRLLKRTNESLYKQSVEMLKNEEEERNRRKEMEQELQKYKDSAAPDVTDDGGDEKYKNSILDETDKTKLTERLLNVMESCDEIYSPDFSSERLAALTGYNYKYVSQVIHEKYDCNFSTFINKYRIKEACKRINDTENYGNLTIEAISNSVDFKSRTTFLLYFKRYTGLIPSVYLQLAREHKEK